MHYGFIGCGNMAGAIVEGCLTANYFSGDDVWVYEKYKPLAAERVSQWGVRSCDSVKEVFQNSDVIFLGVKPNNLSDLDLMTELPEALALFPNRLIISMLAGTELKKVENLLLGKKADTLGTPPALIRIMPNLGARYCQGVTGICPNSSATERHLELIQEMFGVLGTAVVIEEKDFPVFTAIAGCGPAFVLLFIEAMTKAACKYGLNKKTAANIAAQMVKGSGEMALKEFEKSSAHTCELIDRVCSPGGTTIEGIMELERLGFPSAIGAAVTAAVEKDKKIKERY